jgi:hypothetical protein
MAGLPAVARRELADVIEADETDVVRAREAAAV